jgi:hypothetical protein
MWRDANNKRVASTTSRTGKKKLCNGDAYSVRVRLWYISASRTLEGEMRELGGVKAEEGPDRPVPRERKRLKLRKREMVIPLAFHFHFHVVENPGKVL